MGQILCVCVYVWENEYIPSNNLTFSLIKGSSFSLYIKICKTYRLRFKIVHDMYKYTHDS